jgi:hypothetical protein
MSENTPSASHAGWGSIHWIEEDGSGVCPHCGVAVQYANQIGYSHPPPAIQRKPFVKEGVMQPDQRVTVATCTNCGKHVADWVYFTHQRDPQNKLKLVEMELGRVGAFPTARTPKVESEVPAALARDYREAVAVAHISTRAAAALARRGLQAALRKKGFRAPSNKLNDEIALALADSRTSTLLAEKLRFVQHVGNDAAHPSVDADGEFIEVTPEDLTVIIAALEEFYDAYFVKPERHAVIMKAREERKGRPPR